MKPADNFYGVEPVVDMKLVRKILREAMKDPLYKSAVVNGVVDAHAVRAALKESDPLYAVYIPEG